MSFRVRIYPDRDSQRTTRRRAVQACFAADSRNSRRSVSTEGTKITAVYGEVGYFGRWGTGVPAESAVRYGSPRCRAPACAPVVGPRRRTPARADDKAARG